MPIRTALWEVGLRPQPPAASPLANEQMLEEVIVASLRLLSDEWLLIERQEDTGLGGRIARLAIEGALQAGTPTPDYYKSHFAASSVCDTRLRYMEGSEVNPCPVCNCCAPQVVAASLAGDNEPYRKQVVLAIDWRSAV